MDKIKIVQIGTNPKSHGKHIWNSLIKNNDIFDVVGYVFPENEQEKFSQHANAYKGYPSLTLEEVMNNPEIRAVAIETEEKYLTKYALLAAENKKHIHMEKPGGMDLSQFEKLIETVKKNKTVFHTGYMYRYNPYIMEIAKQVKTGEFGTITSIEAQMNCYHPKETRQWLSNFKGGMMFFLGCHLIDLIYSIQGTPEKIIPLNKCSGIDDVESEDFGMAIFEYKNGYSFVKTTAVEVGGFQRRQLVVCGTKKTVELNPLEWYVDKERLFTEKHVREDTSWHTPALKEKCEPFNRYDTMMRSFAQMVCEEKENPWNYDYELQLYKIIMQACGKTK